ncbi:MAG: winged helix-turn-helix domain-containing protein [Tsuneonella sp.]
MNETRSFPDAFPVGSLSPASAGSRSDPQHLARRADFVLGAATIRPSVRSIEGPAGNVAAEPLVMQVLLALVDANGAVVSRDELIRTCWKGHVVGDDSINRTIAEIRRIAREADAGFSVQTIPRVGYRLEAGALGAEIASGQAPVSDLPHDASPRSRRWIIGGALAATAGAVAVYVLRPRPPDPVAPLLAESRAIALAGNAEAEAKAIALLEQAVTRSPENAEAWGLLAMTRARADEHALTNVKTPVEKVVEPSRRALALDPGNADAKAALTMVVPYYGDWLAAERRFDAVLRDHPDHIFTIDSLSFFYGAVGRMRESSNSRFSITDDAPLDAGLLYRRVYAHWFLDQIAEADQVAARGLEVWPNHPGLWFARFWVLVGTGRFQRALTHLDDAAGRPKLPPPMVETLRAAIGAAESGNSAAIERATKMVLGGVQKSVAGVVNALMLLNLMRATDAAFAVSQAYYLEEGPIIAAMQWRPGQPMVPDQRRRKTNMLFTPVAATMQRDTRFMPLMQRIGLVDYWEKRGVTPDFLARS